MIALLVVLLAAMPAMAAEPAPVEVEEGAAHVVVSHRSEARGRVVRYAAWVPVEGGPFPVLYLLHGAWGSWRDWGAHAGEALGALAREHGLVIVTPDGEELGWWCDSPRIPEQRIETYVVSELLPHAEHTLPVRPGARAVAGLSMGGHGALVLALRNPGTFASASSMSGIVDITRHPDQWGLADVLGPRDASPETWTAHSAASLLSRPPSIPLLLTVSTSDRWALEENRELHRDLSARGVEHAYEEAPGDHDWAYWTSVLPRHVAFHAGVLGGGVSREP